MANSLDVMAANAFRDLVPLNPLLKLDTRDRMYLFCLLVSHEAVWKLPKSDPSEDALERCDKLLRQSAKLGAELESEFFHGPYFETFAPACEEFSDLPARLMDFSRSLGNLMEQLGSPGHKGQNISNRFLFTASEFVKFRTGEYHDEHLVCLILAASLRFSEDDDLGDSIRKKRERAKKNYPELYNEAVEDARMRAEETTFMGL